MAREELYDAVRTALVQASDGLLLALIGDRACHAFRSVEPGSRAQEPHADRPDAVSGDIPTRFGRKRSELEDSSVPGVRHGMI
jgi:hypothetical protein